MIADENKISVVSSLVKKTDYDVKVPDIKSKYFNAVNWNKLITLDAKIKQKKLVVLRAIARFISNADLNKNSNISNKSCVKSRKRHSNKITNIWFKLFSWKKSFRWWHS